MEGKNWDCKFGANTYIFSVCWLLWYPLFMVYHCSPLFPLYPPFTVSQLLNSSNYYATYIFIMMLLPWGQDLILKKKIINLFLDLNRTGWCSKSIIYASRRIIEKSQPLIALLYQFISDINFMSVKVRLLSM